MAENPLPLPPTPAMMVDLERQLEEERALRKKLETRVEAIEAEREADRRALEELEAAENDDDDGDLDL